MTSPRSSLGEPSGEGNSSLYGDRGSTMLNTPSLLSNAEAPLEVLRPWLVDLYVPFFPILHTTYLLCVIGFTADVGIVWLIANAMHLANPDKNRRPAGIHRNIRLSRRRPPG